MELAQVVVDAGGEAHPLDAGVRRRLGARPGREQHAVARRLDDADEHRLAVDPQQALHRRAAPADQPVHRATAEAERPGRPDLDADLRHR